MKYFTDSAVDKLNKIGITNLLSDITQRPGSHKGGWTRLLKCQLNNAGYRNVEIMKKDKFNQYDAIIFDLGAEFSGGLNLFGGLDEKVLLRLQEIASYRGKLYSWKHHPPSLLSLESRRENKSTCQAFKDTHPQFLHVVQERLDQCNTFLHVEKKDALLIGDSHTPGMWTPDFEIRRQDGRTLFGSLKNNLITELKKDNYQHIMVQMSSIDVRHHLMRQENPQESMIQMLLKLEKDLLSLQVKNVTLCETMGIEDVSRKLPKTGYYKGEPYFGRWTDRNNLKNLFNEAITRIARRNNWEVKRYPFHFFEDNDRLQGKLKFDVMEKPQSVHISPEFYSWDLEKNEKRW